MHVTSLFENRRLGQQAAFLLTRRSALSGHAFRWSEKALGVNALPTFMKKSSRRDHPSEPPRRSQRDCRQDGRWSFNLASESLFALGTTESARRVAYRTADGQLRFLPL
jgi:hypothetical protein